MRDISKDEAAILYMLYRHRVFGKHHMLEDHLLRGFPREVPEVPALARSSSRSSHRRWGLRRILGPAALSLSSEGNHRERRDRDSDAR